MTDTIFALASGAGRAGVAVIRLSGPEAGPALAALVGGMPPARRAALRRVRDPAGGEILDHGLALWFPGPASFTGEDVAELHLHGGRSITAGVMAALARLPGCRPAEAGEFTRRAFDNGRLDLTEVEGLADLIDADTAAQRRQALAQFEGVLGRAVERWREAILIRLAHLEAAIDFSDEPVPAGLEAETRRALAPLIAEMDRLLADGNRGERLREGFHVAIVGAPNVGKSSLLNALAGREAAIVSARAGTTRDVIEVQLDLAGYPVVLADTAGVRGEADEIEAEGIRRALARAESADLILLVTAPGVEAPDHLSALARDRGLLVWNKSDLGQPAEAAVAVSALTGTGLDALVAAIGARAAASFGGVAEAPILTRARHRHAVAEVRACLDRGAAAGSIDLMAEDLRLAARAIGRIAGRIDVEDLLDRIFAEFCIGK